MPPQSFQSKIERAKTHIDDLDARIQTFYSDNPYVVFFQDDPDSNTRKFRIRVSKDVPYEWSGVVGDAIHNLRSALDHAMVALIRHCSPEKASFRDVYFVIRDTGDENIFEGALREKAKGLSPEAIKVICNLKPYSGGNKAFWILHELDIVDKHRAIIPVGSAYHSVHITVDPKTWFADVDLPGIKEGEFPVLTLPIRPANPSFPLKNGATLFSRPLNAPEVNDDVKFVINIAFGKGEVVEGEPVIPTLRNLLQVVEDACEAINSHIQITPSINSLKRSG